MTEAEAKVSDAMVKAWTNFAIHGTPTPQESADLILPTWSDDEPYYMRFGLSRDEVVTIDLDYRKTFSTKGWE